MCLNSSYLSAILIKRIFQPITHLNIISNNLKPNPFLIYVYLLEIAIILRW